MARRRSETTCRFAPPGRDRRDPEVEAGQALTEYVGLTALLMLVIAIVFVAARPIGTDVGDQLVCAVQQIGTSDAPEECVGEPGGGVDEDETGADEPGGNEPGDDDERDEGEGEGEDELPSYDPDDCTTDNSCEDLWEGGLEPHEPEGQIYEVGILKCNFNLFGWYPHDYVMFSWETTTFAARTSVRSGVCVDGSGTVNIDEEGVEQFDAGENSGWFVYVGADGYEYMHHFVEGETAYFDPSSTIYEVHID